MRKYANCTKTNYCKLICYYLKLDPLLETELWAARPLTAGLWAIGTAALWSLVAPFSSNCVSGSITLTRTWGVTSGYWTWGLSSVNFPLPCCWITNFSTEILSQFKREVWNWSKVSESLRAHQRSVGGHPSIFPVSRSSRWSSRGNRWRLGFTS